MPDELKSIKNNLKNSYLKQRKSVKVFEENFPKIMMYGRGDKISTALGSECLEAIISDLKIAEKEAIELRNFYSKFGAFLGLTNSDYFEKISYGDSIKKYDDLNLIAGFTEEGWVYLKTPSFLPKYTKLYLNGDFFKPIDLLLKDLNPNSYRFTEKCVIAVIQHISDESPEVIRDNDNFELTNLTNYLARNFLVDDSPQYCDFYFGSVFDEEAYVEAFVIPLKDFTAFVKMLNMGEIKAIKLIKK